MKAKMTTATWSGLPPATDDRLGTVIELLDTIFGFTKRFRPRSESAPGPLERLAA